MDVEMIKKYAPAIYFDEKEPFYPYKIGTTVFDQTSKSPSSNWNVVFHDERIQYAIEYAIYWDFDIQHLYDLEHVWVYISKDGSIFDCEASFHGKTLRGLKKDRSNIEEGTHVKLFSQPGKHAFAPMTDVFELLPRYERSTYEEVGSDGLIITKVGEGRYTTDDEINKMVESYMKRFRFRPSMSFAKYKIPEEIFVPWKELYDEIPKRIEMKLEEIRQGMNEGGKR